MITRSVVGTGNDCAANCPAISSKAGSFAARATDASTALRATPSPTIRMTASPLTSGPFFTTTLRMQPVHIVGGGLAGCEAAWQLAGGGVPAVIHEMRPVRMTDAHKTADLAELVCSNSFRSDDQENNAVGLLHEEMRRLGSLIMRAGDANQVPAGGALAVDRDGFSAAVTAAIERHPLIELRREEITIPPPEWDSVVIATGPLTSAALAGTLCERTGEDALAFFD